MTSMVLSRVLPAALLMGPDLLLAQGATGKLQGRVSAAAGAPLAEVQVHLVGTAFSALTDPRGRYFINHIPAGTYDVRAAFIGYGPVEIRGLRILADQTITQDIRLSPQPLQLREIVVLAADNPLVPRDEVTTRQRFDGEIVQDLPEDAILDVVALQPGVVASDLGLSIRGGRPDEAAAYVDGVPVSPGYRGYGFGTVGTALSIGTNAVEQGSVTTGSLSAEFGNAQAGIISIATRTGGARMSGALSYETDELFGAGHSLGFNRIEASLSGPLLGRLTFSVSGVLQGQKAEPVGLDADLAPVFVSAGVDTTVAVPHDDVPFADTSFVDIQRFAVSRGRCEALEASADEGIRTNYGLECQGIRTPGTPRSSHELQAKVNYGYGQGSRLAVTYLESRKQARNFDYSNLYNASNQFGEQAWNRSLMLTWAQSMSRTAERALTLETSLARQADRGITSPLTLESEGQTRDPFGGFMLRPLDFRFDFESFPLTNELVENVAFNRSGTRRTPYDLDGPDQYRLQDQYRNNPYGLTGWSEGGGPEGDFRLYRESRYLARTLLDAQVDPRNRLKVGGEFVHYDIDRYQAALTGEFAEVYVESPVRWNLFAEHRLDLGDVVVVGGLRYDVYHSRAERPFLLDTVEASGTFGEYVFGFDAAHTGIVGQGELEGQPLMITRSDEGHTALSPRIQVSFPVTARTNFRLSYGHQVQAPDFAAVLFEVNVAGLGNDLDFGRTIAYEFGIRHAFSDDMVLDIAAYNRDHRSNASLRTLPVFDPVTGTQSGFAQRFTNADFGNTRGVDVRLDARVGAWFNGTIGYSYQSSNSTGSDPFTNRLRSLAGMLHTAGNVSPPPQAILPTLFSRPHVLTGAFSVTVPPGWQKGTVLGGLAANVGLFATLRYASGTPYTPCDPVGGNESAISGGDCPAGGGPINEERRPAIKEFDLRVTKGLDLGRMGITAYLDARNLLDFRNVLEVFASTGSTVSARDHQARWASDSALFAAEADASGVRQIDDPERGTAEGTIDLRFGDKVASGCGSWVTGGAVPAPPNCIYLIRAEQRYGNGDHLFTIAEQRTASDAHYAVDRGLHQFTGPPRMLRAGLEVTF